VRPSGRSWLGWEVKLSKESEAYDALVSAAREWANHMDQWEKFSFMTPYGRVYVSLTMRTEYPNDFEDVETRQTP
jgi:hypothetical protein